MEDSQYRHAIETARADANYLIACDFLDRPPAWFRAWFDFDLKWSDGDVRYVTIPKIEVENLIARARRDPIVFELLKFIVGTRLRSGVPLPLEMRKLISDFLTNDFKAPKGTAGRREHWGRDFIIINTMRRLIRVYKILPTANQFRSSNRHREVTASEIMAEALKGTKIAPVPVDRIQKIWLSGQSTHDEVFGGHILSQFDDEPERERI